MAPMLLLMGLIASQLPQAGAQEGLAAQPGGWTASGWQAGSGTGTGTGVGVAAPASAPVPIGSAVSAPATAVRPEVGGRLAGPWLAPSYDLTDWSARGLAAPAAGGRWMRYGGDAVLIDATGLVLASQPLPAPVAPSVTRYRSGNREVETRILPGQVIASSGGGPGQPRTLTVSPTTVTTVTTIVETDPAPVRRGASPSRRGARSAAGARR
ncbi:RcnB family protein [Sphingomonas morindae]|uniref:RcnB family protein n=1 Tax=Sphingomonas morindae TaxID=1541170 RepID=A0ABY4XAP9_9SPHN|nr:RcnB family protein [Sphingomonas morindae]USI74038.1 RcnB family protein [Sphingomonas morindae]